MNPMDLVPLVAVFMGILVVLIPVAGITARIALKPIMESWAKYRELRGDNESVHLLEQRISLIEQQLYNIDRSVQKLVEDSDFRRQLEMGGGTSPALPPASAAAPARPEPPAL